MKILLAVDDDEPSYAATLAVAQWFPEDAEVVVVHVGAPVSGTVPLGTGMVSGFGHYPVMSVEELHARRHEAYAEARDLARQAAEITDGRVRTPSDTDPARAIVHMAEELETDLIVLGTGDRSWFSRLLLPSVSDEVTRNAPCSVLVVRNPHDHSPRNDAP